jgi:hypothetical protein
MHSSPEVYNMQHQQNNAYVTHPPHIAKGKRFQACLYITQKGFVLSNQKYIYIFYSTTGTGHVYAHHHNVSIYITLQLFVCILIVRFLIVHLCS